MTIVSLNICPGVSCGPVPSVTLGSETKDSDAARALTFMSVPGMPGPRNGIANNHVTDYTVLDQVAKVAKEYSPASLGMDPSFLLKSNESPLGKHTLGNTFIEYFDHYKVFIDRVSKALANNALIDNKGTDNKSLRVSCSGINIEMLDEITKRLDKLRTDCQTGWQPSHGKPSKLYVLRP